MQLARSRLCQVGTGDTGSIPRRSRAVLESLGYALLVDIGNVPEALKVSGGGAQSRSSLSALSIVLGVDIHAQNMCWEAAGTAEILSANRILSTPPGVGRALGPAGGNARLVR